MQLPNIHRAGELLAESWRHGGVLWVSEGNHIMHGELVDRASGPIAARRLDTGAGIVDPVPVRDLIGVESRDTVLLYSNTGNSAYTDTVTTMAHERGCPVIALTQLVHSYDDRLPPKGGAPQFAKSSFVGPPMVALVGCGVPANARHQSVHIAASRVTQLGPNVVRH